MVLHYEISVYKKVTLILHARLSLSRDYHCKAHVSQRLFPFPHLSKKDSRRH